MLSVKYRKTSFKHLMFVDENVINKVSLELNINVYVINLLWCCLVGNKTKTFFVGDTCLFFVRSTLPFPGSQELYEVRNER